MSGSKLVTATTPLPVPNIPATDRSTAVTAAVGANFGINDAFWDGDSTSGVQAQLAMPNLVRLGVLRATLGWQVRGLANITSGASTLDTGAIGWGPMTRRTQASVQAITGGPMLTVPLLKLGGVTVDVNATAGVGYMHQDMFRTFDAEGYGFDDFHKEIRQTSKAFALSESLGFGATYGNVGLRFGVAGTQDIRGVGKCGPSTPNPTLQQYTDDWSKDGVQPQLTTVFGQVEGTF